MPGCEIACIHAGTLRIVQQRDKYSDLLDREVELPASPDERQALNVLARRKIVSFLTTHYHEIAESLRESVPASRNLHVVSQRNADGTLSHTYQIAEGHDPNSYGEETAIAVGFTRENLERIASQELPDTRAAVNADRGVHVLFDQKGR